MVQKSTNVKVALIMLLVLGAALQWAILHRGSAVAHLPALNKTDIVAVMGEPKTIFNCATSALSGIVDKDHLCRGKAYEIYVKTAI